MDNKYVTNKLNNMSETKELLEATVKGLQDKVNQLNVDLKAKQKEMHHSIWEVARDNNLHVIDNNNIDRSCLSRKKLHLNLKGLSRLANNIKRKIEMSSSNWLENSYRNNEDIGYLDGLKKLRCKFPKNVIISYININSIRNKFDALATSVGHLVDVLTIAETKLDDSFPTSQFNLPGFKSPYRLDVSCNSSSLLTFV